MSSSKRRGRPLKVAPPRVDGPPRIVVASQSAASPVRKNKPKRGRRPRENPLPVEIGRPETGAEVSKRMVGRFILLGPGERKKGGVYPPSTF